MNDLQLVLIVIGGLIIAAVLVFNWWQERRFHQQVEQNFSNIKNDALLDTPAAIEPAIIDPSAENSSAENSSAENSSAENSSVGKSAVTSPAAAEPSFGDSDHYAVAEHDDFSINLDEIQTAPIEDEEHTFTIPTNTITTNIAAEPTFPVSEAAVHHDPVDQPLINTAETFNQADNAVKPAHHEGIKAIFEDAFNKSQSSVDQANEQAAQNSDHAQPQDSAPSLPAMLNAQIDLIAVASLAAEMTVAQIAQVLKQDFDDYGKPVFVHVQTADQRWLLLSEIAGKPEFSDQKVSKVSCSLQLADRAGPVSRNIINRFQLAVESMGLDLDAQVEWQSSGDAAADAVALDAFCIDVDKTMGFHLLHGENGAFTGTKLRGLAEAQGLELSADGTFKYYDEAVKKQTASGANAIQPSFVMFNRDQYPFSPDMLRSSVVKGVTFQLDIPHVSNCTEAYNHMVLVAKQMETGLHAQLVDDNNRPLGDAQIEKIRHQLKIIQATMLTRGIVPGSDVAHRLFS